MKIKRLLHILLLAFVFFLVLFTGKLFVDHASKSYENGRYFDPVTEVVYKQQSVWPLDILLLILIGLLALFIARLLRK